MTRVFKDAKLKEDLRKIPGFLGLISESVLELEDGEEVEYVGKQNGLDAYKTKNGLLIPEEWTEEI